MYAIFANCGKQYKVEEGDLVRVEKIDVEEGGAYTFDQVLVVKDEELVVGAPYVDGACVKATCTQQGKGRKIIVYKYKRKSGYHKKQGHRQLFTEFKIYQIVK